MTAAEAHVLICSTDGHMVIASLPGTEYSDRSMQVPELLKSLQRSLLLTCC